MQKKKLVYVTSEHSQVKAFPVMFNNILSFRFVSHNIESESKYTFKSYYMFPERHAQQPIIMSTIAHFNYSVSLVKV